MGAAEGGCLGGFDAADSDFEGDVVVLGYFCSGDGCGV